MKKLFRLPVLVILCLLLPSQAFAAGKLASQKVDMGKLTCKQFLEEASTSSADELSMILIWLDGFGSAKSGNYVIDPVTLESDMNEIIEHCKDNPNDKLVDLY